MHSAPIPDRTLPCPPAAVAAPGQLSAPHVVLTAEQWEDVQRQLAQAQRLAVIGELTSTTTHEFNNLLMTILNYAKLGQRHADAPTRDKAFARIADAANRAARITGSVLALARNRSGHKEPVELARLAEDAVLLLEREFLKYRVNLELQLEPDLPALPAVAHDLQRVIINLLVNARQATAEGGSVRLSLSHDPQTHELLLAVRDSGAGIPPEILPKIFEPFFSTKAGPDGSGKGGTGLGLSSCKQVIDAHGGRIRVESTLGKGTAFLIRLPLSTPVSSSSCQSWKD